MTDDLEKLARAMAAHPPPKARAGPRDRALDAAMAAFDQEFSDATQGSADLHRLKSNRALGPGGIFRRIEMIARQMKLKPMLLGGTGLAAVALALVVVDRTPHFGGHDPAALHDMQASLTDALEAHVAAGRAETGTRTDGTDDALMRRDAPAQPSDDAASDDDRAVTVGASRPNEMSAVSPKREGAEALAEPHPVATPQPSAEEALTGGIASAPMPAPTAAPGIRVRKGAASGLALSDEPAQRGVMASDVFAPAEPAFEPAPLPGYRDQGRDRFEAHEPNPVAVTAETPVSTFSIDVDTASYGFMRKSIMQGVLPQKDAVRVEELINYFPYDYAGPETADTPFNVDLALMPTPWAAGTKLLRIGIKGYELSAAETPRANLVFLIDSSGSMGAPDKMPLLQNSFRLLLERLGPDDTVAIVAYAGSAGTVLEPTPASEKGKILAALDRLQAGGSTAGGEGIRQAYRLAAQGYDPEAVNRVILATDGDFNVGITSTQELQGFVERKREEGIFLSVLGFGTGNYNDALMQALAQNGNGQAAYIDTLSEARKVLVEEASSTLFPIAKDVKIQVEFNPATVAEYRLIGYESRALAREDFNNDKVDAGEIGAGHRVTALYEITPVGSAARAVDELRYGTAPAGAAGAVEEGAQPTDETGLADEYAFVKIRYKRPDSDTSMLITQPATRALDGHNPGTEARFAAAVAGFGQLLQGGRHLGDWDFDDAAALAQANKGEDPFGYRAEFVNLVRLAGSAAALESQRQ